VIIVIEYFKEAIMFIECEHCGESATENTGRYDDNDMFYCDGCYNEHGYDGDDLTEIEKLINKIDLRIAQIGGRNISIEFKLGAGTLIDKEELRENLKKNNYIIEELENVKRMINGGDWKYNE
jgi:hypothetical protein